MVGARNARNACNSASCQCCICMRVNRVKKPTRLSGSKIKTFKGQRQTILTTKSHISYYILTLTQNTFNENLNFLSNYNYRQYIFADALWEMQFPTREFLLHPFSSLRPLPPLPLPPPPGLADPARQQFITLIGSPAGGEQSMRLSGWSEPLQEEGQRRGGREPACQARERDIQLSLFLCPRYRV